LSTPVTSRHAALLVGSLLFLWGLDGLFGPLVFLTQLPALLDYAPPSIYGDWAIPLRVTTSVLGYALSLGCLVLGLGVLLRPGRYLPPVRRLLRLIVWYNVVCVILPVLPESLLKGIPAVVMAYKGSQTAMTLVASLGDIGCALALAWFVRRTGLLTDGGGGEESGDVPVGAAALVLASAVLLCREGFRLVTASNDVVVIAAILGVGSSSWRHAATMVLGLVVSVGTLVVGVLVLGAKRRPVASLVGILALSALYHVANCTLSRGGLPISGVTGQLVAISQVVSVTATVGECAVLAWAIRLGAHR